MVAVQEATDSAAEGMVVRTEAGKAEVRWQQVAATGGKVAAREAAGEVGTVGVVRVAVAGGGSGGGEGGGGLGGGGGRKWDRWRR